MIVSRSLASMAAKEDQIKLQENLAKFEQWKKDWLMQFNPEKKKNPLIQILNIHGSELQTVDQAKYLGTTISKTSLLEQTCRHCS